MNWQSEFLAVAFVVGASVHLRPPHTARLNPTRGGLGPGSSDPQQVASLPVVPRRRAQAR
jgi:hypothetical protein